ncbi:MAG: RNA-directed DNA polymerase, partial [Planctomycetaceae bacterium]|nr:RNA-directed DNA polymerase [Planctomycetaceae bacterium]
DRPYHFAWPGPRTGEYLDLSTDADERWLQYYGLPTLRTPEDLADWLHIPIGKLAWLTLRTNDGHRPVSTEASHYRYQWIPKRSGGWRLIEAPKEQLRLVQTQILREILDRIPPHSSSHGFIAGRSIITNAEPHLGQKFILKLDLQDFYASVRYARIVAIYRSFGFSREVSIWLARLSTTAVPWSLQFPTRDARSWTFHAYYAFHLPQGAPTSPALANLSAYGLDVRLAGMAAAYGLNYTRYADDLTFSGPGRAFPSLREVIPFANRIIRSERFRPNQKKAKVIRRSQRQTVTGVVVNEHLNVSRQEYDRLKAILHNCVKMGPSSQNRGELADFPAHLRGKIAHVMLLNEDRGLKLLEIYHRIDWSR